jgi:putative ABC transport system ATP-binding protein
MSDDRGERTHGVERDGPVLDVRRVVRTYDADGVPVRALRDASLRVDAGEFVAVTGPSGCGKSTLLGLAAGLDLPDEGSVDVLGVPISTLSSDERARHRRRSIGMVFQFFNLIETMTALENVALACELGGSRRPAAERRAIDLLDLLGIGDKAGVTSLAMSGGQRQRLAIARALANDPAVLLADEPTGALDSEGGQEVLELFRRLNGHGQAIVLVTHDATVAAAAGRVVTMRDGRTERPPAPVPATPAGVG